MSSPTSSGAPPSTFSTPAPARPPRSRTWIIPTVVVVVVVVVLLAALFATGTLRLGTSSSGNPALETFSQAESVASGGASGQSGGTWFPVFGAALATPTALLEPESNITSVLDSINCTVSWPNGEPTSVEIPATPTGAAVGAAAYWAFGFKNVSNALLVVTVSSGTASALVLVTGSLCEDLIEYIAPFPSGVVDSPAIVTAADQAGGSAFLTAYPNATKVWGAVAGAQFGAITTSPVWLVEYTTCSIPPYLGETGQVFNATLGGTSGAVINSTSGPAACTISVPSGILTGVPIPGTPSAVRKAI